MSSKQQEERETNGVCIEIPPLTSDHPFDEDNENEDEEFQDLLGEKDVDRSSIDSNNSFSTSSMMIREHGSRETYFRCVSGLFLCFILEIIVISTGVVFLIYRRSSRPANSEISYHCPAIVGKAKNDRNHMFDFYNDDTEKHFNASTFDNFLDESYGAWGITPNQRKGLNKRWIHWYADALKSGGTIYESACGVGLTMYVILQLLQEEYNITNLEVYGNEYIAEDVVTANDFYQYQAENNPLLKVRLGRICHGDSTNLTFVRKNQFDVVFTGYLDPIVDPLGLKLRPGEHKKYCHSDKPDHQKLMQQEQDAEEEWFASWTTEMVRLVKPGGTIVVESIARPMCKVGDWGGVTQHWWREAITKYQWDTKYGIDPSSLKFIEFDPEQRYSGVRNRYNVKMSKLLKA